MPAAAADPVCVTVVDIGGGYYDFAEPFHGSPGTKSHIASRADRLLLEFFVQEAPRDPLVSGASLLVNGQRILLPGRRGTRRTAFLLECLGNGFPLESADHVLVREDGIIAWPGKVYVNAPAAELAPLLRNQVLASPSLDTWDGETVYAFAPQTDTVSWTIAPGPAAFIVDLQTEGAGLTSVSRQSAEEGFELLLKNVVLPKTDKGPALARLHRLAHSAKCWRLQVGEFDRGLWHLRRLTRA